ncbi:hypothetical protein Tco_0579306, partial [Tanacetum coccineum]
AELRVECYCDAGFETDRDDTKSQTGYVFILNGGAVDWKSSKQSTTAMSATEAEYIAASEAAMEAVWIRKFISGLGIVPTINEPIKMFCDNSAALHFANEPGVQRGARHYHRRYHYVRESIALGEIKLLKVHTDDNLADPFTKALPNGKLTQHARSMGLRLASSFMFAATQPHSTCDIPYQSGIKNADRRTICIRRIFTSLAKAKTYTCMKAEDCALLDRQALGAVRLSLAKNVAYNIINKNTSYGLFKALSNMYKKPSASNKVFLIRQLVNTKMKEGASVVDRVNEFNSILSRLMSVDIKFDDEVQALLYSLRCPRAGQALVYMLSFVLKAYGATSATGAELVKRCGYFFCIWSSRSQKGECFARISISSGLTCERCYGLCLVVSGVQVDKRCLVIKSMAMFSHFQWGISGDDACFYVRAIGTTA